MIFGLVLGGNSLRSQKGTNPSGILRVLKQGTGRGAHPVEMAPSSPHPTLPLHGVLFCPAPSPEPQVTALSWLQLMQRIVPTVKT